MKGMLRCLISGGAAVAVAAGAISCDLGTNPRVTTTLGRDFTSYVQPAWSPDGSRILSTRTPVRRIVLDLITGQARYDLVESLTGFWSLTAAGSNLKRVYPFALYTPDWHPTDQEIVFERGGVIWRAVMSDSSLEDATITRLSSAGPAVSPTWGPFGEVAYGVNSGAEAGIHIVTHDGVQLRSFAGQGYSMPDWSPDGSHLVFVALVGANRATIRTSDSLGTDIQELWGSDRSLAFNPRWSPDSTRIAFVARLPGSDALQLLVMNADGSDVRRITPQGCTEFVSWGPNSREIAYVRFVHGGAPDMNGTIWIVDITGGERQVTFLPRPL